MNQNPRPEMSLLDVAHLRKTYNGFTAVDDVSFQLQAGEVFGLLGPNGAGKSTTMMMLAGLLSPDSGSISLDGRQIDPGSNELKTALGVVPQDLAIYPDLTARENLNFFGRLYGIFGRQLKTQLEFALDQAGLTDRADDFVETFSGGMKRRLNFAVALLHQPRILILDEPTVGVDPQSRSHLLDCVQELSNQGVATIYASHYMEEVQVICQRVAIIDHGKMLVCDSLENLLGRMNAEILLRVSQLPDNLTEQIQGLAEIRQSKNGLDDLADETVLVVSTSKDGMKTKLNDTLRNMLQILSQADVELHAVETQKPNLERLFLELTGHTLRD
jgi:ABC-2 type transport system ATP-binding protein